MASRPNTGAMSLPVLFTLLYAISWLEQSDWKGFRLSDSNAQILRTPSNAK
jgi:hypothetical protein